MSTRRAWGRRFVVAIAVGVLVTVATSWVAMFLPWRTHWHGPPAVEDIGLTRASDGSKTWRITRGSNAWHTAVSYWWVQISGMSLMMPTEDYESQAVALDVLPDHLRPDTVDGMVMQAWYHQTGWPLPAMTCSVHWVKQVSNADIIYAVEDGFQLPRDDEFNPRGLPLRPLLPGFAANTIFWAAIWLPVALTARGARSFVRSRRACCPKCGYSRTGLPADAACPECGSQTIRA